ncbi:MAG: putative zinc-binding metallopeptidase, partial [Rhodospirillales bacterium]
MKLFDCQHCGQVLYFENTQCERCARILGYLPERTMLSALEPRGGDLWHALAAPGEGLFRFCANAAYGACNWLVPADGPDTFCRACRLNRTIPDLNVPENIILWQRLEAAKHCLVYGLLRFNLPVVSKFDDVHKGLAFDFLADSGTPFQEGPQVITGH